MKKTFQKLATASLILGLTAGTPLMAKQGTLPDHAGRTMAQNQHIQPSLKKAAKKKADETRQQIIQDAVDALHDTFSALDALKKGDKEKALSALANATGKLELVVSREPNLALAPVDVSVSTYDIVATVDDILQARREVARLIDKGDLPAARVLLDSLRSEAVVSVTSIPLETYPEAIKSITPLIDKGKLKEAASALQAALDTLVVTRHIIPLPLMRADEALVIAEVLAEKKNRSAKENDALNNMINVVERQLRISEALGYGSHEYYRTIEKQLKEVRRKVGEGKSGAGFFDEIKDTLHKLRVELFGAKENDKIVNGIRKDAAHQGANHH